MQLYQFIAMELKRRQSPNDNIRQDAIENLKHVEKNFLPSGSGIDNGCKIAVCKFTNEFKELEWFEISFGYHHMNDAGYYTNWTQHKLRIKPDWIGFSMSISGNDQNQIKEYLYDTFHLALSKDRLRSEFEKPA